MREAMSWSMTWEKLLGDISHLGSLSILWRVFLLQWVFFLLFFLRPFFPLYRLTLFVCLFEHYLSLYFGSTKRKNSRKLVTSKNFMNLQVYNSFVLLKWQSYWEYCGWIALRNHRVWSKVGGNVRMLQRQCWLDLLQLQLSYRWACFEYKPYNRFHNGTSLSNFLWYYTPWCVAFWFVASIGLHVSGHFWHSFKWGHSVRHSAERWTGFLIGMMDLLLKGGLIRLDGRIISTDTAFLYSGLFKALLA